MILIDPNATKWVTLPSEEALPVGERSRFKLGAWTHAQSQIVQAACADGQDRGIEETLRQSLRAWENVRNQDGVEVPLALEPQGGDNPGRPTIAMLSWMPYMARVELFALAMEYNGVRRSDVGKSVPSREEGGAT